MERYETVKQHELVACPECDEENRVPGSLLLSNDELICPDCDEVIGHAREEREWAVIRVDDEG